MHGFRSFAVLLSLATAISAFGCNGCRSVEEKSVGNGIERPEHWAEKIENPHLKNFFKVSGDLYRGAQPEEEGMKELEKMGIKTVINLRTFHSDRDEIRDAGAKLDYVHITMQAWDEPEKDEVIEFLKVVSDKNRLPVFVHCMRGADRTGTVCAIYRIVFQNWEREEAVREMLEGGFNFHAIWSHLPEYLLEANLDALRREAGINKTSK